MRRKKLRDIIAPVILVGSLASGTVANPEDSDSQPPGYPGFETKLNSSLNFRTALENISGEGNVDFTNQTILTCNFRDALNSIFKVAAETEADGTNNYGFDFKNDRFRLNLGHNDINDEDGIVDTQYKGLFTLYGENYNKGDPFFNPNFIGGTLESLVDGDVASIFGGFNFDNGFHLQATANTDGAFNLAGFPKTKGYYFGAAAGMSADGELTGGFSYNNDEVWASVDFDPKLTAQITFGDIEIRDISRFVSGVTNSGSKELYDGDETIKFATGDFDHFNVPNFNLGRNPGDLATNLRFDEDEGDELKARLGYRIGDLPLLRDAYLGVDVWNQFANGNYGISGEFGGSLIEGFLNIKARVNYDDATGTSFGLFGQIEF